MASDKNFTLGLMLILILIILLYLLSDFLKLNDRICRLVKVRKETQKALVLSGFALLFTIAFSRYIVTLPTCNLYKLNCFVEVWDNRAKLTIVRSGMTWYLVGCAVLISAFMGLLDYRIFRFETLQPLSCCLLNLLGLTLINYIALVFVPANYFLQHISNCWSCWEWLHLNELAAKLNHSSHSRVDSYLGSEKSIRKIRSYFHVCLALLVLINNLIFVALELIRQALLERIKVAADKVEADAIGLCIKIIAKTQLLALAFISYNLIFISP